MSVGRLRPATGIALSANGVAVQTRRNRQAVPARAGLGKWTFNRRNNSMKTLRKTLVRAFALALMSGAAWAQEDATVAFLMPDQASTRYEQHDFPGFKAEMEKLCPKCAVVYQNANADVALQQQQFNSVIAQGAKVIVLDPVDSAAPPAVRRSPDGMPVGDPGAGGSLPFDNGIGKATESLVQHMKAAFPKLRVPNQRSLTDAAGRPRRHHKERKPASALAEFDTPPQTARRWARPGHGSAPTSKGVVAPTTARVVALMPLQG